MKDREIYREVHVAESDTAQRTASNSKPPPTPLPSTFQAREHQSTFIDACGHLAPSRHKTDKPSRRSRETPHAVLRHIIRAGRDVGPQVHGTAGWHAGLDTSCPQSSCCPAARQQIHDILRAGARPAQVLAPPAEQVQEGVRAPQQQRRRSSSTCSAPAQLPAPPRCLPRAALDGRSRC